VRTREKKTKKKVKIITKNFTYHVRKVSKTEKKSIKN